MKVLVTGGSGYIGRKLVAALLARGDQVRATFFSRNPGMLDGAEWHRASEIESVELWGDLVTGCDVVIHAAGFAHGFGLPPRVIRREAHKVNVLGTRAVVQACRRQKVGRVIVLSSIAVAGSARTRFINEETECHPSSEYGRSKLLAESEVKATLGGTATDWCILRPPAIYGPAAPGNVDRLCKAIIKGWPIPIGATDNARSFMYIGNLVDATIAVVDWKSDVRSTFVVADGGVFSTRELIYALAEATHHRAKIFRVPRVLFLLAAFLGACVGRVWPGVPVVDRQTVESLLSSCVLDYSRFAKFFSWAPPTLPKTAIELTGQAAISNV